MMSQHSHNSYPILWSFGIPSLYRCGTHVDDKECKLLAILSSLAKSPSQVNHPWKALRGVDNKIFIIYNLQFTLLRYCNNISFILEAVWATFLCSLVLLLNVSTFPFNSFQSLRSLLSVPSSAGLGYRGLWGSDCFFFDNNELERILWSFDAQSSI